MPRYSKEQILQLYRGLPEELKTALDSDHTIDTIEELSKKYGLSNEGHSALVDSVGHTMMGLLPPNEFEQSLQDLGAIEENIAEEIAKTVRRFLFYPVRKSLSILYEAPVLEANAAETIKIESLAEKRKPQRKDFYREKIE